MQTLLMISSIGAVLALVQAGCASGRSTPAAAGNTSNVTRSQSDARDSREVLTRVTGIVAELLNLKPEEVDVDAPLSKQKNPADELDVVEIVLTVEDAYDIEISDEEIGGTVEQVTRELTVRKLADIVVKKRSGGK